MNRIVSACAGALLWMLVVANPASAAVVTVDFSGTLSSAENNVYDDPDIPTGTFFEVGQAFSGKIVFDTSVPADFSGGDFALFPLDVFNIVIGGVDFSQRFMPRLIGSGPDGALSFVTGGASQGGGASLSFLLASGGTGYPTAAQLNGRTATFSYADFTPLGGVVSGQAQITAGPISAVPEPATWLFLTVGFGAAGGALRRSRRTIATARITGRPLA